METKKVKLSKACFPYKVVEYLKENGISTNQEIIKGTGMQDVIFHPWYDDRASYYLSSVVIPRLLEQGYIKRVKRGHYKAI